MFWTPGAVGRVRSHGRRLLHGGCQQALGAARRHAAAVRLSAASGRPPFALHSRRSQNQRCRLLVLPSFVSFSLEWPGLALFGEFFFIPVPRKKMIGMLFVFLVLFRFIRMQSFGEFEIGWFFFPWLKIVRLFRLSFFASFRIVLLDFLLVVSLSLNGHARAASAPLFLPRPCQK